ncbi:MAG: acyl-CoA dehydrogenase [Candidatus Dadabacteria bacterium]|nr:MAG: acyl-CoA dehydrogenase [Candidatus Dadabacteria bacterium]
MSEDLDLINSTDRFCREVLPQYTKRVLKEDSVTLAKEVWQKCKEQGLSAVSAPEENGGLGQDAETVASLAETIAFYDLGTAIFLSVHWMVTKVVAQYGSKEQKERWLSKLARGEALGAFALSEPLAGSDAASLRTQAVKEKGGWVINGEKSWITSAPLADLFLVFAKSGGEKEISAFLIERGFSGLSIGKPEEKLGCELSPIAALRFSECLVPTFNLLGKEGEGYKIALLALTGGRVNIAACSTGVIKRCLKESVSYLSQRKQFGKPLSQFQALQFKIADMEIRAKTSETIYKRAAYLLKIKDSNSRLFASIAKCWCSDSAVASALEAVQIFGAMGYVKEAGIEKLLRDAKALQIVEGTNEIQRVVIAKEVLKRELG